MTSYKKLILHSTLMICVLFSLFFSITLYAERYSAAKREYLDKSQQYLDEFLNSLDTTSLKIQDIAVYFHSSSEFKEYVENEYVSPYMKRTIEQYISSTVGSMPSSTGITCVTRPNDTYMIAQGSVMPTNYFIYNYGLPSDEIWEVISSAKSDSVSYPYVFFSDSGGKNYMTVILPDTSNFASPYLIFSVYEMDKLLARLPEDTSILISNEQDLLFHAGTLSEKNIEKILDGKKLSSYSVIAESSKTYTMLGRLTCSLILPKGKYISYINHHAIFAILAFLLLFILSLFIAQKVSNKTYSPIQRLINQISSIDTDTLENEIEAISSAITLLSTKNTALSHIVESNRDELREKFVNDLLHGYLTDEQITYGINSYLTDSDKLLPLAIILVDMNNSVTQESIDGDYDVSSLNLVINTLFKQEFENEQFFHFAILAPSSYCVIVTCKSIDALKSRLRKLLLSIESDLGFDMYSSVSNLIEHWQDLPNAFLPTFFSHANLKAGEISRTVYSHDENTSSILYSYEIDNEIFTHCLRRERDKLEKSLDVLVAENFQVQENFELRLPQISILVYALCMRILVSANLDCSVVFGPEYNIYLELKICKSIGDFRRLLTFIFGNIIEHIEQSQSIYEQNYCDSMLSYVHKKYNTDISLQDLAEYMNMSQAYVSRLFKKLTNYNFKDYVAKVRIEQAAKLLVENPEKTIQEISAIVGFNTVKPFTTIFTKLTGMTPSDYRRSHK